MCQHQLLIGQSYKKRFEQHNKTQEKTRGYTMDIPKKL